MVIPTETLAIGPAMRWLALALSSVFVFAVAVITAGDAVFRRLRQRQMARELAKIKWHKFNGVAVLLLLASCLARSAPITGVTQTWTYDPETHSGTVHIVNVSHKNITALSIGLYITQHDGSTFIASEGYDELMRRSFAPGETKDDVEAIPTSMASAGADLTNPDNVRAEVDAVVYDDGTAEVTNQRAFASIIANRKEQLAAMKKVSEVVSELNDPTAIVAELKRLASIAKANGNDITQIELENAIPRIPKDKADLPAFLTAHEQRVAEIEPHVNIKVVRP